VDFPTTFRAKYDLRLAGFKEEHMSRKALAILLCFSVALPASITVYGSDVAYAATKKKKKKRTTGHSWGFRASEVSTPAASTGTAIGIAATAGVSQALLAKPVVDDANRALAIAQRICLVGDRLKFSIDVSGKLNVSKTSPQGTLTASADAVRDEGGVLFQREEIRQLVDSEIRSCMMGQWSSVYQALKRGQ